MTMKNLTEALAIERNRLFLGRESELHWMQKWLIQYDPPTQVLFISGMGGIGKSALLLQFLNMTQNENIGSLWLDGRICSETPAGFLESLQSSVIQKSSGDAAPDPSIQEIVTAMFQKKTLLCIDNYEYIQNIGGWLRGVLLPQVSATGLLLVLASRKNLAFDWQNDLAWRSRVRQVQLAPLSRQDALQFYVKTGLDNEKEIERLISDTQGLPLAMALSAESAQIAKLESGSSSYTWPLSTRVSAELLREVVTSDLKETLDLLCILPQATPELLGRLLGTPLTTMNLHQLSQISFVRPTAGGLALHDVARTYLINDFLKRDPGRYQALRMQIIEELVKDLKEARGQEKKRIASVLLSTCRDVFQINSISIISTNPDFLQMEPFQNTDLPHLHQIMSEEAEYFLSPEAEHALLDALAERFPESIRVFRSADGVPLVYTAGLLLYKETIAFLEPFVPGVLDAGFPLESKNMKQLQLEEANTYYHLLTGVSLRETDYSFYELVGIQFTDSFIHNSAGLRIVIVTSYEETNELLRNLGFRSRLLPVPIDHPLYGAAIHEQDWRGSEFGDHILVMLNASSGNKEISDDFEITEKDIKSALPLVGNPAALGQSELSTRLRCNGSDLQEKLHAILFHSPPFPLNERKQALLRLFCDMPFLTPEMAAERLHISRATYYRVRSEAIIDLKDILIRNS
jgi:hypothetical protein